MTAIGQGQSHTGASPGPVIMIGGLRVDQLGSQATFLRELYNQGTEAIVREARQMLRAGQGEASVARWVVAQRNTLKVEIRARGPGLFQTIAERRNAMRYGNSIGPTYEQRFNQLLQRGVPRNEINARIIEEVAETSRGFNAAGGRLRVAGRVLGTLGFILQATQPSPASSEPLPASERDQVEIERARLRYGIPATANIDTHGHLKPGFYMQVDLFDPHADDELSAETEEILWFLGVPITYTHQGVTWTVPGRQWLPTGASPTGTPPPRRMPPPGVPWW